MPRTSQLVTVAAGIALSGSIGFAGPDEWQLVWADEFDAPAVDQTRWNIRNAPGQFNNELQYYSPDEVSILNGSLRLRSQRRNLGGRQYTSGLVETRGKIAQRYGRIEVRARLPRGQGIWPAHWMLPESGIWPPEIDIMELLGHQPNTVYMTNHWGVLPDHQYRTGSYTGPDFSAGFHTFAMEWTPTRIEWYVDDVLRFANNSGVPTAEPFYIILNTAVGGIWPGNPDPTTQFPQNHDIDFVRVYTKADPGAGIRTIYDYTSSGAQTDGVREDGEYIAAIPGINQGWGDRIGIGSRLLLDSDASRIYVAIDGASPWPNPTPDGVVFYIDSKPGGVTSTIGINDIGTGGGTDRGRALVSGNGRASGAADLFFADGFAADYALVFQDTIASLYRIDGGALTLVSGSSLNAPFDIGGGVNFRYFRDSSDITVREVSFLRSHLEVPAGGSFRVVGTMLNGETAQRSNEYFGVAPGNSWDAVGSTLNDVQLKANDFITMFVQPRCLADYDQSGDVTSQDFFAFLADFFAGHADVNNSGTTTSEDFFAFLVAFYAECN